MNRPRVRFDNKASMTSLILSAMILILQVVDDDPPEGSPFSQADLPLYAKALKDSTLGGSPQIVSFGALWKDPAAFTGKRIRIHAKVELEFRQGASGAFPPLCETWAFDARGNPYCLVWPLEERKSKSIEPGSEVDFEGVLVRLIEYESREGSRLAPLIVGAARPVLENSRRGKGFKAAEKAVGWTLAGVLGLFAFLIILTRHITKNQSVRNDEWLDGQNDPRFSS